MRRKESAHSWKSANRTGADAEPREARDGAVTRYRDGGLGFWSRRHSAANFRAEISRIRYRRGRWLRLTIPTAHVTPRSPKRRINFSARSSAWRAMLRAWRKIRCSHAVPGFHLTIG